MILGNTRVHAAPGLLLIAHGSPDPQWNAPVLDLGCRVADAVEGKGHFKAVRTALLEAAQPDIPTAVAELEAAGCDQIIAVPLFIASSGHTHFDVPAMLGLYSSSKTDRVLASEGAKAARPKVPIILTATIAEGDVLHRYAVDQVRQLSKSPKDEAIVLLAHGDPEHNLLVDRLSRSIATHCCGQTGVSDADWAYVGVGQEYRSQGIAAIQSALERKKRVLVVGLYLSTNAAKLHRRAMAHSHGASRAEDVFAKGEVVFSEGAVLEHPALFQWILDSAEAAANANGGQSASP